MCLVSLRLPTGYGPWILRFIDDFSCIHIPDQLHPPPCLSDLISIAISRPCSHLLLLYLRHCVPIFGIQQLSIFPALRSPAPSRTNLDSAAFLLYLCHHLLHYSCSLQSSLVRLCGLLPYICRQPPSYCSCLLQSSLNFIISMCSSGLAPRILSSTSIDKYCIISNLAVFFFYVLYLCHHISHAPTSLHSHLLSQNHHSLASQLNLHASYHSRICPHHDPTWGFSAKSIRMRIGHTFRSKLSTWLIEHKIHWKISA